MEWISVEDKLPENDDAQIIFDGYSVMKGHYNPWDDGPEHLPRKWFNWEDIPYHGSERVEIEGVTHWMPWPEPPKEGKS